MPEESAPPSVEAPPPAEPRAPTSSGAAKDPAPPPASANPRAHAADARRFTNEGLDLLRRACGVAIVGCLLALSSSIVILYAIASLGGRAVSLTQTMSSEALFDVQVARGLAFGALFAGAFAGCVGLWGLQKVVDGASAFGKAHRRASLAAGLLALISAFGFVVIWYYGLSSGTRAFGAIGGGSTSQLVSVVASLRSEMLVTASWGFAASVAGIAAMRGATVHLLDDAKRKYVGRFAQFQLAGCLLLLGAAYLVRHRRPFGAYGTPGGGPFQTLNAYVDMAAVTVFATIMAIAGFAYYVKALDAASRRAREGPLGEIAPAVKPPPPRYAAELEDAPSPAVVDSPSRGSGEAAASRSTPP